MMQQTSNDTIKLLSDYLNNPEKAQALFTERISQAMRQRKVAELLVEPVQFDDSGEIIIENDSRFLQVLDLSICKSTSRYEENGFIMFRLKLNDNDLMFHGGEWNYWMDGDLDLSSIVDETAEDPWLPISEFKNIHGLLTIADFLLNNEAAWEFTANHPESLYAGMVQAEIKRNNL